MSFNLFNISKLKSQGDMYQWLADQIKQSHLTNFD